jgi:hypothetical protein
MIKSHLRETPEDAARVRRAGRNEATVQLCEPTIPESGVRGVVGGVCFPLVQFGRRVRLMVSLGLVAPENVVSLVLECQIVRGKRDFEDIDIEGLVLCFPL